MNHDILLRCTACSFPEHCTATHAICNVSPLPNCLSLFTNAGCRHHQHGSLCRRHWGVVNWTRHHSAQILLEIEKDDQTRRQGLTSIQVVPKQTKFSVLELGTLFFDIMIQSLDDPWRLILLCPIHAKFALPKASVPLGLPSTFCRLGSNNLHCYCCHKQKFISLRRLFNTTNTDL
jgi:hypothetical protein